jgi:putative transposase
MLMRVIKIKVSPTEAQSAQLLALMQRFNEACNWVSEVAFREKVYRRIPLQSLCYVEVRARFGLPSQLAIHVTRKVCDSYAVDKSVLHVFGPHSAVIYDARVFRLIGVTFASMTLLDGRQEIRLDCGSYQRKHLAGKPNIGQVDLLYNRGEFTLAVTIRKPEPPAVETSGVLGIDLGITNVATDSEGNTFSGEAVKACRRRYRAFRRGLQQCGKKGAKRRLCAISRKQSRFVRWANHNISKQLVKSALQAGKALALENLTGIRERANGYAAEMRWLMGNWSFYQLKEFVLYKAADVGLPVYQVDPRNTSRTCSRCGHCEKANRKSQAIFLCVKCGFQANADFNAACNIADKGLETRAAVTRPIRVRSTEHRGELECESPSL